MKMKTRKKKWLNGEIESAKTLTQLHIIYENEGKVKEIAE
jgi:hypothetical protein